ncbi:MAG: PQQ-dependent sugar dehydrogenase [SAR202 cluster bacterium]|nr:PQQ-dependent sugar dehydrogenase [SAR202 cluster bacterium]
MTVLLATGCGQTGTPTPVDGPTATPVPGVESPVSPSPTPVSPSNETEPLQRMRLARAFSALSFPQILHLTYADDGTRRLFAVTKRGEIFVFANDQTANSAAVFLDLRDAVSTSGNEEGLLGLAFDPKYAENGYFYVYYSAANPRRSVISRFKVSGDADRADRASERVLLEVAQPFANHNGGHIVFGPDGYLYIGLGDGGSGGDPQGNGQNRATVLGSVLRLDVSQVDSSGGYVVPDDNPFVGVAGVRPEIWAYGLRNPWRFNFDRLTGDLWLADVGQNAIEEVNIVLKGRNYGWNVMEGTRCYLPSSGCSQTGLELPVAEYTHSDGCSVSGGYVYRGTREPSLFGAYVYGDYCSGKIWALRYEDGEVTDEMMIVPDPSPRVSISGFGEDQDGELYVLDYGGGGMYRLVPE